MATCSTPVRLDCPICKKKMTQPTTFKCLHFFCKACVDDMKPVIEQSVTGHKCPICSEFTPTEECTEMDFVTQLIDANANVGTEKPLCYKCQTETPTHWCFDCKESFCTGCRHSHNSWPVLKNHKWEEITDATNAVIDQLENCLDHASEAIKLHCKQCQKPICLPCAGENHKDHAVETIENALAHVVPQIQRQKKDIDKVIRDNEKSLTRVINHAEDLKKQYEECEASIDLTCEEVIKQAHADCKQAKEKLTCIKGEQFDKIEEYVKNLELRLKSCKNTVVLCDSALDRAKATTLLCTIQSHLNDRLTKSTQERLPEAAVMEPIRARIMPTTAKHTNVVAEVYDISSFSNVIPYNLATLGERTLTITKTQHTNNKLRQIMQIGDEIWCLQHESNKIHCLSLDLEETGIKSFENTGSIWALTEFDSFVLIGASKGLFYIDTKDDSITNILTCDTCGVAVRHDKVYALDDDTGTVKILKYESSSNTFVHTTSFEIAEYTKRHWNTIHISPENIYVSEFKSRKIRKYAHDGTSIRDISLGNDDSQCRGPRICGSDSDGNLFIAQAYNHRLIIVTRDEQCKVLNIFNLSYPMFATFIQDSLNIVQYNGKISSYSVQ